MELAAGQRRLQEVDASSAPSAAAGADQRVKLVDEEDDLALRARDLLQDRLEALLELAPVLGAREGDAEIERQKPRAPSVPTGTSPVHDPLREPLGDGGLPDARLADQDRVVLRCGGRAPG